MLLEDDVWNRVQDEIKVECDEECYTTEHPEEIDRKMQKLRWEMIFNLGQVEKRSIFD